MGNNATAPAATAAIHAGAPVPRVEPQPSGVPVAVARYIVTIGLWHPAVAVIASSPPSYSRAEEALDLRW